ncbi:MAG: DEAD/DEAH box helicase [Sulfitobacter sp.]
MDIFESCQKANDFLTQGQDKAARNTLILLLDTLSKSGVPYPELLNQMLRETGLYPYMQSSTSSWDQRYLISAFSAQTGLSPKNKLTLHREQSRVLRLLLQGKSVSVSAPTSFGKSLIVDAFIAENNPDSVMIIVPTIALMDEMRRRLNRGFGSLYRIVTTTDAKPRDRTIYVFPQERALAYVGKIDNLDLLIIDEFYKISSVHDKERSSALYKAALKFSPISKQRYFLSPNISHLHENPITDGMRFVELLQFNTVYLREHNLHRGIKRDVSKKFAALEDILSGGPGKTLIYAGSYTEIEKISNWFRNVTPVNQSGLHVDFAKWLAENYSTDWHLPHLVARRVGVHNGRMHRCLSQLQVKLFDLKEGGLDVLTSTSSIIEGVNTSAQTVVVWNNKNGGRNLSSFSYKNIVGRGGRMFKHFVGDIYILEKPPENKETQLEIDFPEKILGGLDADKDKDFLSASQVARIGDYDTEMEGIMGRERYRRVKSESLLSDSDANFLLNLARSMKNQPRDWNGLAYLNSHRPSEWDATIYKVLRLKPGAWEGTHTDTVRFLHVISQNWRLDMRNILQRASSIGVDVEKFFQLERTVSYKLSSLISDANVLYQSIIDDRVDVSPFATRVGYAFLPKLVYQLEEAGMPRMISRKIHNSELFNMEASDVTVSEACDELSKIGTSRLSAAIAASSFEEFILDYFVEGVTPEPIDSAPEQNGSDEGPSFVM